MNKFIANYHNGVRFYSKTISLNFPDKITSYKKGMKNKGLVLVLEREQFLVDNFLDITTQT